MNLEQIDTSTTVGKAEVMRLAAEGRAVVQGLVVSGVQCRVIVAKWEETSFPEWNWREYRYAIIAEPVGPDEVWVQQRDGALWAYPEYREGSVRYVRADE